MMLRESVEAQGKEVELAGIVQGADAVDGNLPAGRELIRFAEAIIRGSDEELATARKALRAVVGPQGVADAAGVTGSFECVNRIADGAGLPLDEDALAWSKGIREELGLNSFSTAVHTFGSDES
jgi:hypothetical protein